jgi:hypothetical protein
MARLIAVVAFLSAVAPGAESRSPALASELTDRLAKAGLDAVAAVDPENPDRFVAALVFPRVQLLVVDASVPVPAVAIQHIAARQYRDAYMALQQSAAAEGRIFVHDMGGDGLRSDGGDVVYESGVRQTVFDGAPRLQKLSEAAYQQRFAETDQRYSRMLALLIEQLKRTTTP